jgi:acyl-CoA dehydrogenase
MPMSNSHPVPDRQNANLYLTDPMLGQLLGVYLPPNLRTHLEPHLAELGALAGGRLDELAAALQPSEIQ